ncbi:MAG: SPFH domain / Band 7 family protein [candidate division BRC1 bacterium ADurb.BinA364]|nr:MAG: SPFH domain / Band 7 family protein [candidate division BRC1 bacterium ADurb.BinA364]
MTREQQYAARSGWGMLAIDIALYIATITLFVINVAQANGPNSQKALWMLAVAFPLLLLASILISIGFFILQPNQAAVLLLFGRYVGTAKSEGFRWANPFYTKKKISLRLRNLNGDKLKVNDKAGNPIEIAAVVVWKVRDTFAACFEVDDYIDYVETQSESALRHLTSAYPYDSWDDEEKITLRGDIDEVSTALEKELQERLHKAGVEVLEARLSHLAYAPEIAEAMLRRQQASAIIAARQKIVEGAVGMVRMALEMLNAENVVALDDERKASMVSNLLVVLCGETNAQPVVNAGTLYH